MISKPFFEFGIISKAIFNTEAFLKGYNTIILNIKHVVTIKLKIKS